MRLRFQAFEIIGDNGTRTFSHAFAETLSNDGQHVQATFTAATDGSFVRTSGERSELPAFPGGLRSADEAAAMIALRFYTCATTRAQLLALYGPAQALVRTARRSAVPVASIVDHGADPRAVARELGYCAGLAWACREITEELPGEELIQKERSRAIDDAIDYLRAMRVDLAPHRDLSELEIPENYVKGFRAGFLDAKR